MSIFHRKVRCTAAHSIGHKCKGMQHYHDMHLYVCMYICLHFVRYAACQVQRNNSCPRVKETEYERGLVDFPRSLHTPIQYKYNNICNYLYLFIHHYSVTYIIYYAMPQCMRMTYNHIRVYIIILINKLQLKHK